MKEKILEKLTEKYSNLGLSKRIFELQADTLAKTVTEESQIDEAVSGVADYLKAIQSFGDQRAAGKRGKTGKGNMGDEGDDHDDDDDTKDPKDGNKALLDLIKKQNDAIEGLTNRLNQLDGSQKQKEFDDRVSVIAKELNLKGDLLDLAKAKLSSDMDDKAIRDSLGATKQIFIKSGAHIGDEGEGQFLSEEDAARKEAAEWVKANEIKE